MQPGPPRTGEILHHIGGHLPEEKEVARALPYANVPHRLPLDSGPHKAPQKIPMGEAISLKIAGADAGHRPFSIQAVLLQIGWQIAGHRPLCLGIPTKKGQCLLPHEAAHQLLLPQREKAAEGRNFPPLPCRQPLPNPGQQHPVLRSLGQTLYFFLRSHCHSSQPSGISLSLYPILSQIPRPKFPLAMIRITKGEKAGTIEC